MDSFYGGLNGQSFTIKEEARFKSRKRMEADLSKGWTSPISVGEFALVSYGMPNDVDYAIYRDEDLATAFNGVSGKSYNATVWQKVYDESAGNVKGLSYKLVTSLTSLTPKLDIVTPITVLGANKQPEATIDNSDVDNPKITLKIPGPWSMNHELLQPENLPSLAVINPDSDAPYLHLSLPKTWVFDYDFTQLTADKTPSFRLIKDQEAGTATLELKIPNSERISVRLGTPLNAGQTPTFEYDDGTGEDTETTPDFPILTLHLPQAEKMISPEVDTIGPAEEPVVELVTPGVPNQPQLAFKLPRAVQFVYGNELGESGPNPYYADVSGMLPGDYYINIPTGFIYIVEAKAEDDTNPGIKFRYVANLQAPKPVASANPVSPYMEDEENPGEYIPADLKVHQTNTTTGWTLGLDLPRAPIPQVEVDYVSSESSGDGDVEVSGTDTIKFILEIPKGTRAIVGTDVDDDHTTTIIPNTLDGDLYMNNDSGEIYKLTNKVWIKQTGKGLKGPVGNPLHFIATVPLNSSTTSIDAIPAAIDSYLAARSMTATNADIVVVTYTTTDDELTYWYVLVDGVWKQNIVTGGVGSLLQRDGYTTDPEVVDSRAYTVEYINSIIGGERQPSTIDRTAYSKAQVEQLISWGSFTDLIPTE